MRSRHLAPHSGRRLLCSAMLTLLTGCHPAGPDASLETYPGTLGATLSVAIPGTQSARLPQPPLPGQLQLELPPSSLDGLDFLALRGCAVQATLLKRNSSLGRLAKPSQRLLLALEYLDLAPACIAYLRDSNNITLADLLEAAWLEQREQLPTLIFNATLGSDEYQAFWLAAPAPGQYPRVSRRATTAALAAIDDYCRRWLDGDYRAQNRELEILLSEVAGGVGGARMEQHYRQLFPPIAALEAQLITVLPQRYRSWMVDRDARFARFANAQYGAPTPKIDYTERIIGIMRSRP